MIKLSSIIKSLYDEAVIVRQTEPDPIQVHDLLHSQREKKGVGLLIVKIHGVWKFMIGATTKKYNEHEFFVASFATENIPVITDDLTVSYTLADEHTTTVTATILELDGAKGAPFGEFLRSVYKTVKGI